MALTYLKVACLLVLFSSVSFAQDQGDFDIPAQGVPDEALQNGEYDQELMEQIQKIMLWGCYFLTKNVMYSNIDDLNVLFQFTEDKEKLYRKIAGDLMLECATNAGPQDMQELINGYGKEGWSVDDYNKFHTFSVKKYENIDLSNMKPENEDPAFNAYFHIDQMIQEQAMREDPNYAGDYEDFRGQYKEPTFAGIPLSDISTIMKVVFVCSTIFLIGSIVFNLIQKRQQVAAASGPVAPTDKKLKGGKSKEGKGKETKAEAGTESTEKKKDKNKAKTE